MEELVTFLKEWYDDSKDYIESRTSGSTGEPKIIRLAKRDMELSAKATNHRFGIGSGSRLGVALGLGTIAGKMMVVRALTASCALNLLPVKSKVEVDVHYDLLAIVPAQFRTLLGKQDIVGKVGNLLLGGAPLSDKEEEQIAGSGLNAYIGYGMTETCSHVALRKVGVKPKVYKAMDGVRFATDSRGCLIVEMPARKDKRIVTNDIVELIDSGKFLWKGRADMVINSGGKKLMMDDLAKLYSGCGITEPFYVAKTEDERWGERPVLVVECSGQRSGEIMEMLKKTLPSLDMPVKVMGVERLPMNKSGKPVRIIRND